MAERIAPCFTHQLHKHRLKVDKKYQQFRVHLKEFTDKYIERSHAFGLMTPIIKIPVVVHVVYNTDDQNISYGRILSQIQALNRDYRMNNVDIDFVQKLSPNNYALRAVDTRIEFELACRDPECNATDGYTLTTTNKNSFNIIEETADYSDAEEVKHSANGHEAWPTDRYLNIWVCNLTLNDKPLTGYSTYPGDTGSFVDGVVINYEVFGTEGLSEAAILSGCDNGRWATHEIGHWLNVYHVSCDSDPPNCTDSDDVADTPNQRGLNAECPYLEIDPNHSTVFCFFGNPTASGVRLGKCDAFPHVSCASQSNNDGDGDMFMNFMDYTRDKCRVMFTAGQAKRMESTLFGPRLSILGSDGLIPPPLVRKPEPWIRNSPADLGLEPDDRTQVMYLSDDIWVNRFAIMKTEKHPSNFYERFDLPGILIEPGNYPLIMDHQNPVGGEPCVVIVRIRNRGCAVTGDARVKLYWAKASSALGWPAPWDGSVTSPAVMGGLIGEKSVGRIKPHEHDLLMFPWTPPKSEDYSMFGEDKSHFCLLARIETDTAQPYGMSYPETHNLWENVKNNNKIAWKNISIVYKSNDGFWNGHWFVGSIKKYGKPIDIRETRKENADSYNIRLTFKVTSESKFEFSRIVSPSLFDLGKVELMIGDIAALNWKKKAIKSDGIILHRNNVIDITKHGAWIDLGIDPRKYYLVGFRFIPFDQMGDMSRVLSLDIIQEEPGPEGFYPVGGQRFVIKTQNNVHPPG